MSDFLYKTDDIKAVIGENFCGPDVLPHGEEVLVAVFADDPKRNGHGVELYCISLPVKFYTIKALDSENSMGTPQKGFILSTGSGQLEWAVDTAKKINEGMVGIGE